MKISLDERLKKARLSISEKKIMKYIKDNINDLEELTIKDISKSTYTSDSLVIRLAKKLKYYGWRDMRDSIIYEHNKNITMKKENIDTPFDSVANYNEVMESIKNMEKSILDEAFTVLDQEQLRKAVSLIINSKNIDLYAQNFNLFIAQDFAQSMVGMPQNIYVDTIGGNGKLRAMLSTKDTCAIIITVYKDSYYVKDILNTLKETNAKIIAITPKQDSELEKGADVVLNSVALLAKDTTVGNYARTISTKYILDVLFGCVFLENYEENIQVHKYILKNYKI